LISSDDVLNLNKIFSCSKLTDDSKRGLWNSLYGDDLFTKLTFGWSLEDQATEEVRATLGFYIPVQLQENLISRLAKAIVASKDINNEVLTRDMEVNLNLTRR
jgi:ribosome-associated toxin RatA of RatAB toxin-antitoxin module